MTDERRDGEDAADREMTQAEVNAMWQRIVSGYGPTPADPGAPREQDFLDVLDALDAEGYAPPEPPPLSKARHPLDRFAWFAVIIGPLLIVVGFVARLPAWLPSLGVVAFVLGFGALIWRRGDSGRDPDDDGAVV